MTKDPLSFVDEPAANPEPKTPEPASTDAAPASPQEPAAAAPKAPEQLQPGKEPSSVQPPAPAVAQPEAGKPDAVPHVPLPKYLDAYNELREIKRERDRLRQELQAKNAPPQQAPDPIHDPDGYRQHILAEAQKGWGAEVSNIRYQMSEQMARQVYGNDKVNAAFDALEKANDPHAFQRVMNSPHPAAEIVKWHQQKQLLDQIGDDPDAFVRRRWAELNGADPQNPAALQPVTKQAVQIPAPSLTRAPAGPSAGTTPVGPGQAFDAVFPT